MSDEITQAEYENQEDWADDFAKDYRKLIDGNSRAVREAYQAGYKAHAARNDWIPIGEMSAEWKDGRCVDFARYVDPVDLENGHINPDRIVDCFFCVDDEIWLLPFASPLDMSTITHARLPPNPPTQKETP